MEYIGVFRENFNPIHIDHVNFLNSIKKEYNLSKIILVLTNNNRNIKTLASNKDRLNMCKIATKNIDFIDIYTENLKHGGPQYTVDILQNLSKTYKNCSIFFILPCGTASYFERLYKFNEILQMVNIVVCESAEQSNIFKTTYSNLCKNIFTFKDELTQINSTKLRCAIAQKKNCSKFLNRSVYSYIKNKKLYNGKNFLFWECFFICKKLNSKKRFLHCSYVSKAAKELAKIYNQNELDAKIAGILHDIMKEKTENYMLDLFKIYNVNLTAMQKLNPKVWHGPAGAIYIKNVLGIENENILNAVKYHTVPRKDMTMLEKIIFVADAISQDRQYKDVRYQRKLAKKNLDDAVAYRLQISIISLIKKQNLVYSSTLDCYNELIFKKIRGF